VRKEGRRSTEAEVRERGEGARGGSLRDEPLTCWGVLYTRKECPC